MNYKIFFIACLFSFSACNDWLDIELANVVDEDKLFSTSEGFQEALAGVYNQMAASNLYGSVLTMEYMDLYAQYYSYSSVNSSYEQDRDYDYQNNSVKSRHAQIWNNLYACISGVNNVLKWEADKGQIMGESLRKQVKGEALALRAFLHFDLYRMFCPDVKRDPKVSGIPYNKEFGVSLPPVYTVEEVVQLVLNDLLEAEKEMANEEITTVTPYTLATKVQADKYVARMNLYAVKAMIARVHQARGDRTNAIKYAEEVINSGKFRLLDFSSVDKSEQEADILFSDEHIFSLLNPSLSELSQKIHYREYYDNGSYTQIRLPFGEVSTTYEGNNDDIRYTKWFSMGNFMKYVTDNKTLFPSKMPVIKLSEMYLLLADCYFSKDGDKALQYINTLRDHRIRNNVHWGYLTRDYIVQEMRREYLGEGQMWYVYKRDHMGVPSNGIAGTFEPDNSIFVFPMPDKEIETGHRDVTN